MKLANEIIVKDKNEEDEHIHNLEVKERKHKKVLKSVGIDTGNVVEGKRVRKARDVLEL